MTRSDAALAAKIDKAQLFRMENSDNAAPTFASVAKLARVLDVSLDWLATDAEPSVPGLASLANATLSSASQKSLKRVIDQLAVFNDCLSRDLARSTPADAGNDERALGMSAGPRKESASPKRPE